MNEIPASIPSEKRELLERLIAQLASVPGVIALVLGGSYARGAQRPDSDLDIGLYYSENEPFEIAAIRAIAEGVSDRPGTVVTDFYGWGPWVNGGAWIYTSSGKVDFIYRNLDQVARAIEEAKGGRWHHDYEQQPPAGFFSVTYLAETRVCIPCYDPQGWIARLKQMVAVYPPLLKEKVISDSLWLAEFTLGHARNFAARGDIYNTAGCLVRIATYLTQALFALNETYFLNDKTALQEIESFSRRPEGYGDQVSALLGCPGQTSEALSASAQAAAQLWESVGRLAGDGALPPSRY